MRSDKDALILSIYSIRDKLDCISENTDDKSMIELLLKISIELDETITKYRHIESMRLYQK